MKVTKIPPLTCPQCGSTHVSPGFTNKKTKAFLRDNNIYCYDCMKTTNTKTGTAKEHNYRVHILEEK